MTEWKGKLDLPTGPGAPNLDYATLGKGLGDWSELRENPYNRKELIDPTKLSPRDLKATGIKEY